MAAVQTDAVDSREWKWMGKLRRWGGEEECHRIYTGKQGAGPCNKRKERLKVKPGKINQYAHVLPRGF